MRMQLNRNTGLLLCLSLIFTGSVGRWSVRAAASDDPAPNRADVARIQQIVDDLKGRLAIPQPVTVSMVESNPLMVSVEPVPGGSFALAFEAGFAERLSEEQLMAAVAHELGHVWIYTHFPFLQTEQLANEIAMRVVSRESLVPVYAVMFERARVSGDLNEYLGDPHRPADH
jgi:hypothetical protein